MSAVDEHDLELRRAIFDSFAATGSPPAYSPGELASLAVQHVVALVVD